MLIQKFKYSIVLLGVICGLLYGCEEKPQPKRKNFGRMAIDSKDAAVNLVKEKKNKDGKVYERKVSSKAYNVYVYMYESFGDVDEEDYLNDHPDEIILELLMPGEKDFQILVFSNSEKLDSKYFSETIISNDDTVEIPN